MIQKEDFEENKRLKQLLAERKKKGDNLKQQINSLQDALDKAEKWYDEEKEKRLSKGKDGKYEWEDMRPLSPGFLDAPAFQKLKAEYDKKVRELIEKTNKHIKEATEEANYSYTNFPGGEEEKFEEENSSSI